MENLLTKYHLYAISNYLIFRVLKKFLFSLTIIINNF